MMRADVEPLALHFAADGAIPNHPHLPVLHYRAVLEDCADRAAAFERAFAAHDWPAQWRDGIYPYHHYHAGAHEAFGIAAGTAEVLLGGPHGQALTLAAGDVLVLPAGTGHCRLSASADFLAVGAYPRGAEADMQDEQSLDLDRLRVLILAVPIPASDPVGGAQGYLPRLWSSPGTGPRRIS